ncbi:hypothetical protein FRC07_014328 [Ceratobasidium sp. 392]|nr:hypothetical protein FRC07_014328 [Ceratobasidium sp. 392]
MNNSNLNNPLAQAIGALFSAAQIAHFTAYLEEFLNGGGGPEPPMWRVWLRLRMQSNGGGLQTPAQTITQANTVTITTEAFSDLVTAQRRHRGPGIQGPPFNPYHRDQQQERPPRNPYQGPPPYRPNATAGRPPSDNEGRNRNRRNRQSRNGNGQNGQSQGVPTCGQERASPDITMLDASGIAVGGGPGAQASAFNLAQMLGELPYGLGGALGTYTPSEDGAESWRESNAAPSPAPTTTTVPGANTRMEVVGPTEGTTEGQGEGQGNGEGSGKGKEKEQGGGTVEPKNLTDHAREGDETNGGSGSVVAREGEC